MTQTSDLTTAQLIAARLPGHALPRDLYCGEQAFQDDLEQIWYREWLFAVPAASCPRPAATSPCRSASIRSSSPAAPMAASVPSTTSAATAAASVRQSIGTNPKLVCPYHQWTYDLNGKLLFARDMGPEFDPSKYSLKPVHCVDLNGMIFICLAQVPRHQRTGG